MSVIRVLMVLAFSLGLGCTVSAELPSFDANRSYDYLTKICKIGPRISGTPGMEQQRDLIVEHFETLKAKVAYQAWDVPHPVTGQPTTLKNIIVQWHPQKRDRVLLGCHYDTRPHPDQEFLPSKKNSPFIGANDGASGVALLMELGNQMANLNPAVGVDFVLFDAEELVYSTRDKYFLGSTYFATAYRDQPPAHRYHAGILLDMIADKDLQIYKEVNSVKLAPAVTESVWKAARALKAKEFIPRSRHEVQDDHLSLNQIAKIPTCDLIDFDYPHWHTTNDIPAACSGKSMQTVGRVLIKWLEDEPATP